MSVKKVLSLLLYVSELLALWTKLPACPVVFTGVTALSVFGPFHLGSNKIFENNYIII